MAISVMINESGLDAVSSFYDNDQEWWIVLKDLRRVVLNSVYYYS
jgi:hypothetical protein